MGRNKQVEEALRQRILELQHLNETLQRRRKIGMKTVICAMVAGFLLLVGTELPSQIVVSNLSAATPFPNPLVATEEEVRGFFAEYIDLYNKKELEEFLLLFSAKAKQNQRDGLAEIRTIYGDLFNRSQSLQISIEDMKIEIYQNAVKTKARYTVNQALKEGGEKRAFEGDIRWVLAREEGKLQIVSVDYQHSVSPDDVSGRQSKPKEEPPKSAVVKPEVPLPPFAGEEEVEEFFTGYIRRYNRKDINGFLSFFSSKAVQNQKDGLKQIKKVYAKLFDESQELRYHLEDMKIEISQNAVEVKAGFIVDQILKRGGEEKVLTGTAHWVLVKEDGTLKIISLNYQNQNQKSP